MPVDLNTRGIASDRLQDLQGNIPKGPRDDIPIGSADLKIARLSRCRRQTALFRLKKKTLIYSRDPDGHKWLFYAHIRKTNPRGDIVRKFVPGGDEELFERSRRIMRRGITHCERRRYPMSSANFVVGGNETDLVIGQAAVATNRSMTNPKATN